MRLLSFLAVTLVLLVSACSLPEKPKAVITVEDVFGEGVAGVTVAIGPSVDSIPNPSYDPEAAANDSSRSDSLIAVNPDYIDTLTTNNRGQVEFEVDFSAIIRATAYTDSSFGTTMVNLVEGEKEQAYITLTPIDTTSGN